MARHRKPQSEIPESTSVNRAAFDANIVFGRVYHQTLGSPLGR
jgi:hypothetical protein